MNALQMSESSWFTILVMMAITEFKGNFFVIFSLHPTHKFQFSMFALFYESNLLTEYMVELASKLRNLHPLLLKIGKYLKTEH